jgi:basic membrane protein A and related proteins
VKRTWRLLFALLALALVAAACGDSDDDGTGDTTTAPETTESTGTTAAPETTGGAETTGGGETTEAPATTGGGNAAGADFSACQVTDTGGADDRSFNQTAYAGLQQAEAELGVQIDIVQSQDAADYQPNIQSMMDQECDLIVTVGFLLDQDTATAATNNPEQLFAIVDFAYDPPFENVRGLTFKTDEAAFLAGYLAAGMSETGIVGTFGGINIPTVTIFMEGLRLGIEQYNTENGTDVQLLGWDGTDGLFTGNFESTDDGRAFGQNLIDEGADIILPVAGPVGLGTAAVAQEVGNVKLIGVDADQYVAAPEFSDVYLTSVLKNMDVAVFDTVAAVVETGSLPDTLYTGTLENDGIGLAPFHDFEADVPAELSARIEELRQEIIDGTLTVGG